MNMNITHAEYDVEIIFSSGVSHKIRGIYKPARDALIASFNTKPASCNLYEKEEDDSCGSLHINFEEVAMLKFTKAED